MQSIIPENIVVIFRVNNMEGIEKRYHYFVTLEGKIYYEEDLKKKITVHSRFIK